MGVKIFRQSIGAGADSADDAVPGIPRITVVICTRDRPRTLRRALRSLQTQVEPPMEILVIDNLPRSDAAKKLVADEFPAARYVLEMRQGLDFARNRALEAARGDVVAFLDDDAVADCHWVQRMRQPFVNSPHVALCTGRVEALSVAAAGQALFEANGGFGRGSQPVRLPADARRPLHGWPAPLIAWAVSVGSGTSYAVRRSVALELGGFDEALDMGELLPGGGDHDMLWRVLQAGYEVRYEPEALAWHEHRFSEADAVRQIAGHQRALVAMLLKSLIRTRGRARWGVLSFLAWRLVKPGVRLARRAMGRDPLPPAVLLQIWWHSLRGLTAYFTARRIAHRRTVLASAT